MTPADVYFGRVEMRQSARQKVMAAAFDTHPERKWPSQASRPFEGLGHSHTAYPLLLVRQEHPS